MIIFSSLAKILGIDSEEEYLQLNKNRKVEIENPTVQKQFWEKMYGFKDKNELSYYLLNESQKTNRGE